MKDGGNRMEQRGEANGQKALGVIGGTTRRHARGAKEARGARAIRHPSSL